MSQMQIESRLVCVADLKAAAVVKNKHPEYDDVRTICAVVSRAVTLREIQSKKRADPYYFVEFEVTDNSCDEPLGVKLWGEIDRFSHLRHQLVQGTIVVLQSIVLHSDYFREKS